MIFAFLCFIAVKDTNAIDIIELEMTKINEIKVISEKFKTGFSSIPSFYSKTDLNKNLDSLERAVIDYETLKLETIVSKAVQDNTEVTNIYLIHIFNNLIHILIPLNL